MKGGKKAKATWESQFLKPLGLIFPKTRFPLLLRMTGFPLPVRPGLLSASIITSIFETGSFQSIKDVAYIILWGNQKKELWEGEPKTHK